MRLVRSEDAAPPGAPPPATAGLRLAGRVVWGALPVPGARVVLKGPGNYYDLPVLTETVTGEDGRFVIENPPPGRMMAYAISPSEEYWEWTGRPITVGTGQTVEALRFELSKKMELIEPDLGATVATTAPVLRWESFPGAARYHVDVFNDETGDAVMRADTTETSMVAAPPLAAGGRYQWSVTAFNFARQQIAYYSSWLFMVQP